MTVKSDPTNWVEFVLERFTYNYKSETVHWKSIYSEDGCGSLVQGWLHHKGYKHVKVCGKSQMMHRVVWVLVTGRLPEQGMQLDHIDGDRSNNNHRNLREVTQSTNMHNNKAAGCYYHKQDAKWYAQIKVLGTQRHLGAFNTQEEARAAYEAAKKINGFIHR